ncbi:MAG: MmgE/PrpD family protein [Rhodospirillaceae bacterium]
MDPASTISARIADYACRFSYRDLSDEVIAYAKLLLLDLLGAALAGVDTEEGRAVTRMIADMGAGGRAPVWRSGLTTSPAHAAFANGTIAHAQEMDDFNGCDHSGAVAVPAIFAIAEAEAIDDAERVLTAMALGYEFGVRMLDALGGYRAHNNPGWHSTGTCGAIGAAVAAAKMLKLDATTTRHAIGLAGNAMGGTWSFLADGTMAKRANAGRAAENGVTAAYLARAGFTGPAQVFEAEWGGIFNTFTSEPAYPERFFDGLGCEFGLLRSGIKPHASCRGAHSATDSALRIRAAVGDHRHIDRVLIRCSKVNFRTLGNRDPQTRLAAQMSLPYCVASAFVFGTSGLDDFEQPRFDDPTLRRFLERVAIEIDPAITGETPAIVEATLDSGERRSEQTPIGLGDPANPMSPAEVVTKYFQLATRSLSQDSAARLRALVDGIDRGGSVLEILGLLR